MGMHSAEEMEKIGEDIARSFLKLSNKERVLVGLFTLTAFAGSLLFCYNFVSKIQ